MSSSRSSWCRTLTSAQEPSGRVVIPHNNSQQFTRPKAGALLRPCILVQDGCCFIAIDRLLHHGERGVQMAAPAARLQCCCRLHPFSKLQGKPEKPLGVLDGQLQISRESTAYTQRAGKAQAGARGSQAGTRAGAAGTAAASAPSAVGSQGSNTGALPCFIAGEEACIAQPYLWCREACTLAACQSAQQCTSIRLSSQATLS